MMKATAIITDHSDDDDDDDVLGTVVDTEDGDEEEEDVPDGPPELDSSGNPVPVPAGKRKTRRRRARKLANKTQDFQVSFMPKRCLEVELLKYIHALSFCDIKREGFHIFIKLGFVINDSVCCSGV